MDALFVPNTTAPYDARLCSTRHDCSVTVDCCIADTTPPITPMLSVMTEPWIVTIDTPYAATTAPPALASFSRRSLDRTVSCESRLVTTTLPSPAVLFRAMEWEMVATA